MVYGVRSMAMLDATGRPYTAGWCGNGPSPDIATDYKCHTVIPHQSHSDQQDFKQLISYKVLAVETAFPLQSGIRQVGHSGAFVEDHPTNTV